MRWVLNGGFVLCVLGSAACLQGQEADSDWRDPYDSGGPLIVEQAAYDVTYYDLALAVDPADSTIAGTLRMDARMVAPAEVVALDLDTLLAVESISLTDLESAAPLSFRRSGSRVFVELPFTKQPDDDLSLTVEYGGKPRVAPRPPWDGGVQWAATPSGDPWIATSNQMIGADVWWPNKDHVSDKPDSMRIRITVPDPLVVATNGRQEKVTDNGDGTRTYDWFVSTPISNYNVALNIAPYEVLKEEYRSVTGETFPVVFWVLPEYLEDGLAFMPEILEHLRWFERTLGPYPFRADKYGVAQTPHLGMEHQSIIAYGANFDNGAMTGGEDWGFDALHHHELSHEWWGNLVTNADWKDMWIHEGFGSYMQALWLEDTQGLERYHEYMASVRPRMGNAQPTAPRHSLSAQEVYGGDIYFKGAWVLHTLRYLLGDEAVREALRRMAYPTEEAAWTTDGSQVRFVSTADVITVFGDVSGQDLGWLFEAYLRQAELPALLVEIEGGEGARAMELRWQVPGGLPFPMPVPVRLGDRTAVVDMTEGSGTLQVPAGVEPVIDSENWILRATQGPGFAR
ncbi:MAG: M1 family metallopeptidase [Gemmatimonadetes bacterium]|nr:M1 family metallopeptidase [Gemmatimonadota bacterium]